VTDHIHHDHDGHQHGVAANADPRHLMAALGLIVAFMAAEVVAGLLGQSLALLSDAAHMLTDAGALALSLVAMRLAARPPRGGLTYGLKRAEILSALINGVTLVALALVILAEAIRRLLAPPQPDGPIMLAVALAGIAVNLLATWQLARANRTSLNVRGSYQHILTDLYAFVGTAAAAAVIMLTGFARADAIASLLIAGLMLWAGGRLIRDAGRVLLEAAPEGMNAGQISEALLGHPRVVNVHDFHLWEITSGLPALSAHVLVPPGEDCHAVRRELEHLLESRFDIVHTTLQVDHIADRRPLRVTPMEGRAGPG
jgi:cobalt-zinc-cadmium efflux system protein